MPHYSLIFTDSYYCNSFQANKKKAIGSFDITSQINLMNISSRRKKIITFFVLSLSLTTLGGCEIQKYCDNNDPCLYVLPNWWFYIRFILIVVLILVVSFVIIISIVLWDKSENAGGAFVLLFIMYLLLLIWLIRGINFKTPIWQSIKRSEYIKTYQKRLHVQISFFIKTVLS